MEVGDRVRLLKKSDGVSTGTVGVVVGVIFSSKVGLRHNEVVVRFGGMSLIVKASDLVLVVEAD